MACQMYNDEFCKTVCQTILREKNNLDNTSDVLGRLSLGPSEAKDITRTINELIKVDPHEKELFFDVTGQTLSKIITVESRWMAARDGCKVITTKKRDINKGDQRNPNYRAMLVGREIKTDSRLDSFAATDPLESLRMICSMCAGNQTRQICTE